ELTEFLGVIAWHVTTGNPKNDDYRDARWSISAALTRTLWDNYRVTEFDQAVDRTDDFGELNLSFQGVASSYIHRRDAPARPKSALRERVRAGAARRRRDRQGAAQELGGGAPAREGQGMALAAYPETSGRRDVAEWRAARPDVSQRG